MQKSPCMEYSVVVYDVLNNNVRRVTSQYGDGFALRIENDVISFFYSIENPDNLSKSWGLDELAAAMGDYEAARKKDFDRRFIGLILCHSDMERFLLESIERKIIPEETGIAYIGDGEVEVDAGQISDNLAIEAIKWQNRRR